MAGSKPDGEVRGKCPICTEPADQKYRPFCSRRCADVDLSRWLRGAYAIPDEAEDEDGESTDPGSVEGSRPAEPDDQGERKRR